MDISLKEYIETLNYIKFPTSEELTEHWLDNLWDHELRSIKNKKVLYDFDLINYFLIYSKNDLGPLRGLVINKDTDEIYRELSIEKDDLYIEIFIPINIDEMYKMISEDESMFILTYGKFTEHIDVVNKFKSQFRLLKSLSDDTENYIKKGAS